MTGELPQAVADRSRVIGIDCVVGPGIDPGTFRFSGGTLCRLSLPDRGGPDGI